MDSIIGKGLDGIRRGVASAVKHADEISRSFNPSKPEESTDAVEPAIALQQDKRQVEASAKVIKVSKELDESVLDIVA